MNFQTKTWKRPKNPKLNGKKIKYGYPLTSMGETRFFWCEHIVMPPKNILKPYFSEVLKCFVWKITKNCIKSTKQVENSKKVFQLAFKCVQHPKAGQNTLQSGIGKKLAPWGGEGGANFALCPSWIFVRVRPWYPLYKFFPSSLVYPGNPVDFFAHR